MKKNYTYKRISEKDKNQVYNLVDIVYSLERKDFLIPWTKEQLDRFFDEEYSYLYGAYDGDKLIAMTQLFTTKEIEDSYYDILNIERTKSICEVGGFLVFVSYRNQGIMSKLAKMQYDLSINLGYDYIISTAHPDNIESNKILKKIGLELIDTIETESGYLRNVWVKKLK